MPKSSEVHVSASSDTREQILDAAEQLIGDQGIDRASVRAITELAGANLAAVSYHFGSKDALVREVFERRLRPINQERVRLLAEHLRSTDSPDLESIVRAFVLPPFGVLLGEEAANFGRCMVRVMADPGPQMRDLLMEVFSEVMQRFVGAVQSVLPGVDPAGIFWRFHFMLGSMAYTVGMRHLVPVYSRGVCDSTNVEEIGERLVEFVTAGMRAGARGGTT